MKAYVTTTGVVFALLTLVHIWRVFEEGHLLTDPWYLLITLAAAAPAVWAGRLVWLSRTGRA